MTKLFYIVLYFLISSLVHAQLPDKNTYLIGNVDNYGTYSALWGYTAEDNRQYAILGCDTGTSFVDITDSSDIHEVDFVSGVFSTYREMKTYSHYAYVVSEGTNSRLQIIDLQYLPDSVSMISTYSFAGYSYTHAISQSGPYLYLSGGNASPNGGVRILEITNPLVPVVKGNYSSLYSHDCRVRSDTLWVCNILNRKVSVINASDKDNPVEITNFLTISQTMPHNCALTVNRDYLYVSHENLNPGNMSIWNVQDLSNITYVKDWQPTGITTSPIHNVEIYDTFAIAAHYTAGIRILNISDPANPVEVAWYDTRPEDNSNMFEGCWAAYKFPDGKIIGSDISNGLFIIKATIITSMLKNAQSGELNFYLSQNFPNPFNPVTQINYDLRKKANVTLRVYDAGGKEVETLVSSLKNAGRYSITFDGAGLPSGIYFYKLETENFREVKKMLLIK